MCKRWWWVFLVMAVIGAVCGLIVAAVFTFLMPKAYESQAVIEVRPAPGEKLSCKAEVKKIGGPEMLGRVVSKLELDSVWKMPSQAVIERLREVVKCTRVKGTNRIAISVRLRDRFEAMEVVNALAQAFKHEREKFPKAMAERVADLDQRAMAQFDKLEDMASTRPLNRANGTSIDWRKTKLQELVAERREYEALTTALEAATSNGKAQSATVILHQAGTAQQFPVSPNISVNLAVGKVLGCLLSLLLAMPIVMLLHRRFPPACVAGPSDNPTKENESGQAA